MAGNPPEWPDSPRARALEERADACGTAARPLQAEHSGPVAIARYVKADGRALILYTHDSRERT
jgi:hypothetical protein